MGPDPKIETAPEADGAKEKEIVQSEGQTSPQTPQPPPQTPQTPQPSETPPGPEPVSDTKHQSVIKTPENDSDVVHLAQHLISIMAKMKARESGGMKTVRIVGQLKNEISEVSALIESYRK